MPSCLIDSEVCGDVIKKHATPMAATRCKNDLMHPVPPRDRAGPVADWGLFGVDPKPIGLPLFDRVLEQRGRAENAVREFAVGQGDKEGHDHAQMHGEH